VRPFARRIAEMASRTAAILLAGGESARMGRPKPLLVWGDETLVEYQVRQLQQAGCNPVIVVLGAHEDAVRPLVHRTGAHAVINELYAQGRASSVRVGAGALAEDIQAALILNVDQPRPVAVHRQLLAAMDATERPIAVAAHDGHRGHPVAFAGAIFPELREVREATEGMRAVMERHENDILEVTFDTPVVLLDLNRPEDYEAAKSSYFASVHEDGPIRSS
jgi:CTP:molybdopterin cytidylyltransferase MocA